jgi:hypothetical protein
MYIIYVCNIYMYTYIHTCIHRYKPPQDWSDYAATSLYIHTYIHTCIHTYTHTCIHTYIGTNRRRTGQSTLQQRRPPGTSAPQRYSDLLALRVQKYKYCQYKSTNTVSDNGAPLAPPHCKGTQIYSLY